MSEGPDILITAELFEAFGHWKDVFNEREAYLWLGVYGPQPMNARFLAKKWNWPTKRAIAFLQKMLAVGLFAQDGKTISAVVLRDAERHPEYVIGQSWRHLRLRVFVRDGFACTYCGATQDLHCDHVFPRSRGGLDVESNLTTACGSCNLSKGARTPEEWRA